MGWFDNHSHLDDERIPGGVAGALDAMAAANVIGTISIGTDIEHSESAIALARAWPNVWATVGLHPHDAREGVDTIEPILRASHAKVVAVGECGLDYYYDNSPRDVQRHAFAQQIALARELQLTLVVHTRDAWDDTFAILDEVGVPEHVVVHCFSGGPDNARACLDRGAYLSFSGIVSFPKAPEVRAAAVLCPLDRLLVETDSPYLAPVPHRGRPNSPALVPFVGAAIADARGIARSAVEEATTANVPFAYPRIAF